MPEVLVGFGGNIGDVRTVLHAAVAMLCDGREVRLVARSSDYRTPPWGLTAQPPFVNLCIAAVTALAPAALLQRALSVERAFGRERASEQRWGPRAVDIDILAYDDLAVATPELVLPHPRLLQRAFVLVPLAEIRPQFRIGGTTVAAALAGLDTRGIEPLPPLAAPPG